MKSVEANGLDGSSALGFLAALGALLALEERKGDEARLSWTPEPPHRPRFDGVASLEELVDVILEDLRTWEEDPLLKMQYPKLEKNGVKMFGGLNPPIRIYRAWIRNHLGTGHRRAVDYAGALMTDAMPAVMGESRLVDDCALEERSIPFVRGVPAELRVEQTAFDFTSRNTQFLDQIDQVRRSLDAERIRLELEKGEPTTASVRSMSWNPEAVVPGALSGRREERHYPAMEWLAFRGLACLPVVATSGGVVTSGCTGRRKSGRFRWPIWETPIGSGLIKALIRIPGLEEMTVAERRARGICAAFYAELTKGADGYQGVFSPSAPC